MRLPEEPFATSAKQQQEAYWANLLAQEGLSLLEASPEENQAALQEAVWLCEVCAQSNTLLIESLEGNTQHHMQDCAVCCNPHQLACLWNEEGKHWQIEAAAMNGA